MKLDSRKKAYDDCFAEFKKKVAATPGEVLPTFSTLLNRFLIYEGLEACHDEFTDKLLVSIKSAIDCQDLIVEYAKKHLGDGIGSEEDVMLWATNLDSADDDNLYNYNAISSVRSRIAVEMFTYPTFYIYAVKDKISISPTEFREIVGKAIIDLIFDFSKTELKVDFYSELPDPAAQPPPALL